MWRQVLRSVGLVVLSSALLVAAGGAQGRSPSDLGVVAIPQDFDHRTQVFPKGNYQLALLDGELVLIHRVPDTGLEYSFGLDTREEEAGDTAATPRVEVDTIPASGRLHVRIRVYQGAKRYTALLRASVESGPRPEVQGQVDPAILHEVALIQEAHALLARDATRIWPGWTNHDQLEYVVTFPNRAVLIVSGRARVPDAYEALRVPPIGGRRVYIDRSSALKDPIGSITGIGAHGDIAGVTADLRGPLAGAAASVKVVKRGDGDAADEETSDLSRMLTYVHEAFHCLQAAHSVEREKAGLRVDRGRMARNFDVNTDFATYAELEGDALERAVEAPTKAAATVYLRDALLARQLKQQAMPAGAVVTDLVRTRDEGTATYANLRAAMLAEPRPGVRARPPQSAGSGRTTGLDLDALYRRVRSYVRRQMSGQMTRVRRETQSTAERFYIYGAYLAMALDRVAPGWKNGLFERDRTLDDVLAQRVPISPALRARIRQRFDRVYRLPAVRARHEAAIQTRAREIDRVRNRKGRAYQVDVSEAQPGFDIRPRGSALFVNREQLYPHGLDGLDYGSLRLTSVDTPMRFAGAIVEWVDTEPVDGDRGYDLRYARQTGDLYEEVTVTTKGFAFTAKAVRLVDTGSSVRFAVVDR